MSSNTYQSKYFTIHQIEKDLFIFSKYIYIYTYRLIFITSFEGLRTITPLLKVVGLIKATQNSPHWKSSSTFSKTKVSASRNTELLFLFLSLENQRTNRFILS